MIRAPLHRTAAAVFAAWFALVAADAPGLHACAMHDSSKGAVAHGEHHAASQDAAHPAAHHAPVASETPPSQAPEGDRHQCLCLGDCAGAHPVATPAQGLREPSVFVSDRAEYFSRSVAHIARADLALPLATAPPVIG